MVEDEAGEVHRWRDVVARTSGFGVSAALHATLLLVALLPAATGTGGWSPSDAPRAARVVLPPAEDDKFAGLNPVGDPDSPAFARDYADVQVRNASFDVTRIANRAHVLFPFISPGLSLKLFALEPEDDFDRLLHSRLLWSAGTTPSTPIASLDLTPAALQALVDRTWARRDRWATATAVFDVVERHDPEHGDAPRLIREYTEQNLGQYYEDPPDGGRDARLWTELALAADHLDFIRYVRTYASAHPGTKGTTELLFLLDKVVESNRNVLGTLLSTHPPTDLTDTRLRSRDAYALIVEIKQFYEQLLQQKQLTTKETLTAAYDAARIEILEGILRTSPGGYRANDARALLGRVHWGQGHPAAALDAWCAIAPQAGSDDQYSGLLADLTGVLGVAAGAGPCHTRRAEAGDRSAIERILLRERGRAWRFQHDRLRAFGYTVSMF